MPEINIPSSGITPLMALVKDSCGSITVPGLNLSAFSAVNSSTRLSLGDITPFNPLKISDRVFFASPFIPSVFS